MEIKDKVAIITGASAGIGEAAAKLLTAHGARVALVARSKDKLDALAAKLPGSLAVQTDMSDAKAIASMVAEVHKHFGRIDILVNNAGQGIYGAIAEVDPDALKKIIDVNVLGPLRAMQRVIPIMREQGGGAIVNISSMLSKMYIPQLGAYAATKYALNALSLTARQELEPDKITVGIVLPTLTDTDFGKNAVKTGEAAESMESRERPGQPPPDTADHVAELIVGAIESGEAEILARPLNQ